MSQNFNRECECQMPKNRNETLDCHSAWIANCKKKHQSGFSSFHAIILTQEHVQWNDERIHNQNWWTEEKLNEPVHFCDAPAPSAPFFSRRRRSLKGSSTLSLRYVLDSSLTCVPASIYCCCSYCCQGKYYGDFVQFVSNANNQGH